MKKYIILLIITIIAIAYSTYKYNSAKSGVEGIQNTFSQIEIMSERDREITGMNETVFSNMVYRQLRLKTDVKDYEKILYILITLLIILIILIFYQKNLLQKKNNF